MGKTAFSYLGRKLGEYEEIRAEIEQLREEVEESVGPA